MKTTFDRVPIGATFEYRGCRYTKLALSLAEDPANMGCMFLAETPVECEVEQEPEPPPPQPTAQERIGRKRYQ